DDSVLFLSTMRARLQTSEMNFYRIRVPKYIYFGTATFENFRSFSLCCREKQETIILILLSQNIYILGRTHLNYFQILMPGSWFESQTTNYFDMTSSHCRHNHSR